MVSSWYRDYECNNYSCKISFIMSSSFIENIKTINHFQLQANDNTCFSIYRLLVDSWESNCRFQIQFIGCSFVLYNPQLSSYSNEIQLVFLCSYQTCCYASGYITGFLLAISLQWRKENNCVQGWGGVSTKLCVKKCPNGNNLSVTLWAIMFYVKLFMRPQERGN